MKKSVSEKLSTVSRQAASVGVIQDDKGNIRGRILVRFTPAQIGYNHEVSVHCHALEMTHCDDVAKGSCYENPATLFDLFDRNGHQVLDGQLKPMTRADVESRSGFYNLSAIKSDEGEFFTIFWAL